MYAGELHDRFWLYWYQLWLAERAVHAALLGVLLGDALRARSPTRCSTRYADRYLDYPNVDNVLGPSRLFFSTYLESIWLLQLCIALDLLESARRPSCARSARACASGSSSRARALIASYDEGLSNRQVWNDAALIAAGALLGDARDGRARGARAVRARHAPRARHCSPTAAGTRARTITSSRIAGSGTA